METDNGLLDDMLSFIVSQSLAEKNERFLLAVSGGMDSVVMVDLFSRAGFDFAIAHCNFSLRGKESDEDETFVSALAGKNKTEFYSRKFDTPGYANENKISIQMAARDLRYTFFEEIRSNNNFDKIVTAHHLNDSIETFFMNLIRGTGVAGLRGIPVINHKIIRPLLFASRNHIETYQVQRQLSYREDSSNQSDYYLRNKIRHKLIPILNEITTDFEKSMYSAFEHFSALNEQLNDRLNEWKATHVIEESSDIRVSLSALNQEQHPASFLSLLLHSYGITGVDCKKVLKAAIPGKVFSNGEFTILRDRDQLIIRQSKNEKIVEMTVGSFPVEFTIGEKKIFIQQTESKGGFKEDESLQMIDADNLALPLTIRTWKKGDYFYPLGMTGRKKVSDFFIDNRVNLFEKEKTLLLLSSDEIVCILGHRIDNRYRIKPTTRKILRIELSKNGN